MATIATHNGSKVHREHNIRNPKVVSKEKHIIPGGVFEIWHDEKVRDAYSRLFGEAVKAYNEKQDREERKIKNYYRSICKDEKKHPAYEMIVGVYGNDCDEKTKKEILREFVDGWQKRNPNLELIGAYFHADEQGGTHIHIDYIPVAHGYKKGLETQTALNKALEEIGFITINKRNTAQMAWEHRENKYLEELCNARGIAVERPKEAQKEHLDTETYQATKEAEKAKSAAEKAAAALDEIQRELQDTREQLQPVRAEYEAKKEYVKNFEGEFLGAFAQVKENKSITGKVKSYDVPAAVWETQRIYQADITASEAAREVWEAMVTDYTETKEANKTLQKENVKLRELIDKVNETLSGVSQNVREAFLDLFKAKQEQTPKEHKNSPETPQNEYEDIER